LPGDSGLHQQRFFLARAWKLHPLRFLRAGHGMPGSFDSEKFLTGLELISSNSKLSFESFGEINKKIKVATVTLKSQCTRR
jgi:hypothetical protein